MLNPPYQILLEETNTFEHTPSRKEIPFLNPLVKIRKIFLMQRTHQGRIHNQETRKSTLLNLLSEILPKVTNISNVTSKLLREKIIKKQKNTLLNSLYQILPEETNSSDKTKSTLLNPLYQILTPQMSPGSPYEKTPLRNNKISRWRIFFPKKKIKSPFSWMLCPKSCRI